MKWANNMKKDSGYVQNGWGRANLYFDQWISCLR